MASTAQKNAKGSSATSGGTSAKKASRSSKKKGPTWESRAVLRLIEPGSVAECPECGERVKFRARHRDQQVICNVYEDGVWQRVEQYHQECYDNAGTPYGEAVKN
jgi:DNA-directed RNA polymerase subunit RPC12/RpoP